ncbi:MAG: PEP-CTERM sorting domain-containing protein [Burkholderiales bacterium]|nr:PEP-CTERM sorting domain-containing protein [Burkholderiales bacterium]
MKIALTLAAVLLSLLAGPAFAGGHESGHPGKEKPPAFDGGPEHHSFKDVEFDFDKHWGKHGSHHGGWDSHVPCVPEPESVALMLAGLGVVGAAAWRRRNQGR